MAVGLPTTEDCLKGTRNWPHAPPHHLAESGVYFLTARTRDSQHLLQDDELKDWFQSKLLDIYSDAGWQLEAWAIFSNHHHLVTHSPPDSAGGASKLGSLVQKLRSLATREINSRSRCHRTRLWQNYRETHLTLHREYLARPHYVHQNAVHHRLVTQGSDWKWCSARRFKETVSAAWVRTVASFKYEEIAAKDGE